MILSCHSSGKLYGNNLMLAHVEPIYAWSKTFILHDSKGVIKAICLHTFMGSNELYQKNIREVKCEW